MRLFGGGLLRFWGGPALSEMLWRPAELGARSAPFETFAQRLVCILFVNSLYNRKLFRIFEH